MPGAEQSTLTDQAYKELEERIVTLRIAPGAVLSEASLGQQLGLGRTPIREALQRLARDGLVVILSRRGILVSDTNVKRQLMLLEVRRELERLIAVKAAQRATEQEREEFLAIADGMEEAARSNDDIMFMRLDRTLNLLMSAAARNEFASNAMAATHALSRRFWYVHYKEVADLPVCARLHASLARAVGEGDTAAARVASEKLLDYIEDFTRATLDTRHEDRAGAPA
jgi:DNA-binding GntR family transcriptional regulator